RPFPPPSRLSRYLPPASVPRRDAQRLFGQLPCLVEFRGARLLIGLYFRDLLLQACLGLTCRLGGLVLQSLHLRIDGLVHGIDASLRATFRGFERGLRAGNLRVELRLRLAFGLSQLLLHLIKFLPKRSGIALILVIDHIAPRSAENVAAD